MPFITEKIYLSLPSHEDTIVLAAFPVSDSGFIFEKEEENAGLLQNIVYTVRNIRGENKIQPGVSVKAILVLEDEEKIAFLQSETEVLIKLAKIEKLEILRYYKKEDSDVSGAGKGFEVFIPLEGIIDIEKERERLIKESDRLESSIGAVTGKLKNKSFVEKAPKEIVEKEKEKLNFLKGELEKINKNLKGLK